VEELQQPYRAFNAIATQEFTGVQQADVALKTLAYPNGLPNSYDAVEMARFYYIAARYTGGMANMPNKSGLTGYQKSMDYHRIYSESMDGGIKIKYADRDASDNTFEGMIKSMYDSNFKYRDNVNTGAWFCIHAHRLDGIDPVTNMTREAKLDTVYKNYLAPAIAARQVWAGTFPDVAMYAQERDKATLAVTPYNGKEIKYTLTDEMDDALFDYPLTIKVKIDPSWEEVTAIQNGNELPIRTVTDENGKYALIQTIPDKGEVSVSSSTTGINNINDKYPVIETRYYTVQGFEVKNPSATGIYIVKKIRATQQVEVSKERKIFK
jgi:hypothetical protein